MAQDEVFYLSDTNVLICTKDKLKLVKCPFDVECVVAVNGIYVGEVRTVWRVLNSEDHKLLYKIQGKLYPYKFFHVVA